MTESITLPTTESTRELLREWLTAKTIEDLAHERYQTAEGRYKQAVATTARVTKDVGALVSRDMHTRHFIIPELHGQTVIEVTYNQYDAARPYIREIKLETL